MLLYSFYFHHSYKKHDWRRRGTSTLENPFSYKLNADDENEYSTIALSHTSTHTEEKARTPLLQISIIRDVSPNLSTPIFNYVGFRMMPLAIETDSATLQLLYYDFISDLKSVNMDEIQAKSEPEKWMNLFNKNALNPHNRIQHVDIFKAQLMIQATKLYFRQLVIHPMKIVITFVQSPFPRRESASTLQSTALNILTSLAGFDRLKIKLKSFQVEDAMESRVSLVNHVINNIKQDLQSQIAQIAGSLALFGSPVGFANKIGNNMNF